MLIIVVESPVWIFTFCVIELILIFEEKDTELKINS